jgi:DNA topoisomerase-3
LILKETTRYDPNGFDAHAFLREHSSHSEWGKTASYLLRKRVDKRPPKTGKDCGDHPPITPLKSASRGEV